MTLSEFDALIQPLLSNVAENLIIDLEVMSRYPVETMTAAQRTQVRRYCREIMRNMQNSPPTA